MSKKVCKIEVFYSTNLQEFMATIFSGCTFFHLFPRVWNQRKILRIFDSICKKDQTNFEVIVYTYEYFLELVELA